MAIIGLDIGGTKLLGAVFNKEGQIIDKEKQPTMGNEGQVKVLRQIHKVIDTLIERSEEEIEGIGVGVPGATNKKGIVLFTPNLPFENFDLKTYLKEKYNLKVAVGNDVNLGTFGEYSELDIPHGNVIGLFPGTGLGGGIIIDGELYIGKGSAGELGHIVVQKDGVKCGCGNNGCLESYASKKGIQAYLERKIEKGRDTILKDDVKKGILKSSRLKYAYDIKDKQVVKAIDYFTDYLGMGVGIIINIFNPDMILISGGIIEEFGKDMLTEIKEHAKTHAMPSLFEKTKIKKSKLGDNAVIYGAYHLVRNKLSKKSE